MSKHPRTALMTVSSVLFAVAPKCPICLCAYFGIFGVAAASASVYRMWLPPITAIWLALTVGMLAFQRGGQRRYGPALLGLVAGVAVFAGKFVIDDHALVYCGVATLVGATVWRSWFRRLASNESCTECEEVPLLHDKKQRSEEVRELPTYGRH